MLSRTQRIGRIGKSIIFGAGLLVIILMTVVAAAPTVRADDCIFTCFDSREDDSHLCNGSGPYYCQSCQLVCKGDPNNQ